MSFAPTVSRTVSRIDPHRDNLPSIRFNVLQSGMATTALLVFLVVPFYSAANRVQFSPTQRVALGVSVQNKDGDQEFDERFDRLQRQQQMRQELNQQGLQQRLDPQESPSLPASNRLQTEQQIQQQLNLYELQHGQGGDPDAGRTMDRLQLEQQMQQQLNQNQR